MIIADVCVSSVRERTQGDIVKRTGLLRRYISRVENGQTVPAIETLEKLARALEVPCISCSTTAKNHPSCRIS